jgi:hypothetical protein
MDAREASPVSDLVERLRARAKVAREENTGTAHGDAVHFDEAASEIERLRPYMEAFRREEDRADKLGREVDDLRETLGLSKGDVL